MAVNHETITRNQCHPDEHLLRIPTVLHIHECSRHRRQPTLLHLPHLRYSPTLPRVDEHTLRCHWQLGNVTAHSHTIVYTQLDLDIDRVYIFPRGMVVPG